MQCEKFIVGFRLHQVTDRRQKFQTNQNGKKTSNEEKQRDGYQIQQADAFMVQRQKPWPDLITYVRESSKNRAALEIVRTQLKKRYLAGRSISSALNVDFNRLTQ